MAIPGGHIRGHVAATQRDGSRVSVAAGPSSAEAMEDGGFGGQAATQPPSTAACPNHGAVMSDE